MPRKRRLVTRLAIRDDGLEWRKKTLGQPRRQRVGGSAQDWQVASDVRPVGHPRDGPGEGSAEIWLEMEIQRGAKHQVHDVVGCETAPDVMQVQHTPGTLVLGCQPAGDGVHQRLDVTRLLAHLGFGEEGADRGTADLMHLMVRRAEGRPRDPEAIFQPLQFVVGLAGRVESVVEVWVVNVQLLRVDALSKILYAAGATIYIASRSKVSSVLSII